MKKKTNSSISNWPNTIKEIAEKEREISNKLSPNKSGMKNALAYSKELYETVVFMSNLSSLTHEGLIDFEIAQKILDAHKEDIKESIKYLEIYLGINEVKEV